MVCHSVFKVPSPGTMQVLREPPLISIFKKNSLFYFEPFLELVESQKKKKLRGKSGQDQADDQMQTESSTKTAEFDEKR